MSFLKVDRAPCLLTALRIALCLAVLEAEGVYPIIVPSSNFPIPGPCLDAHFPGAPTSLTLRAGKRIFIPRMYLQCALRVILRPPFPGAPAGAFVAGVEGAISTYGAILSEDQAKIIRRAEKVIAAFDNDGAGLKASEQMRGFARKYGIDLSYFNYKGIDVKDVGDMTIDEIHQGIETAKHMVLGKEAYGA